MTEMLTCPPDTAQARPEIVAPRPPLPAESMLFTSETAPAVSTADPEKLARLALEGEMIASALSGEEQGFADLYHTFSPHIFNYLSVHVDPDTAGELTQEAFIKAFRALPSYEQRGFSIGAWLRTISRNLLMDHFRRQKSRPPMDDLSEASELRAPVETEATVIGRCAITAVLDELPKRQRDVVQSLFILGESPEDYAERTGISIVTVRTSISKARRHLRELRDSGALAV